MNRKTRLRKRYLWITAAVTRAYVFINLKWKKPFSAFPAQPKITSRPDLNRRDAGRDWQKLGKKYQSAELLLGKWRRRHQGRTVLFPVSTLYAKYKSLMYKTGDVSAEQIPKGNGHSTPAQRSGFFFIESGVLSFCKNSSFRLFIGNVPILQIIR